MLNNERPTPQLPKSGDRTVDEFSSNPAPNLPKEETRRKVKLGGSVYSQLFENGRIKPKAIREQSQDKAVDMKEAEEQSEAILHTVDAVDSPSIPIWNASPGLSSTPHMPTTTTETNDSNPIKKDATPRHATNGSNYSPAALASESTILISTSESTREKRNGLKRIQPTARDTRAHSPRIDHPQPLTTARDYSPDTIEEDSERWSVEPEIPDDQVMSGLSVIQNSASPALSVPNMVPQTDPPPPGTSSISPPPPLHRPQVRLAQYEKKIDDAAKHLDIVRWKPQHPGIMPTTDRDYLCCINAVAAALRDTTQVRDRDKRPMFFAKFGPDGTYSDQDYEATATSLVHQAVRMYSHGATSLFFKVPGNYPPTIDASLGLKDRLSGFMRLIREFKQIADDVMCGRFHEEFLAAPITSWYALRDRPEGWNPTRDGAVLQNQQRVVAIKNGWGCRLDGLGRPYYVDNDNRPIAWRRPGVGQLGTPSQLPIQYDYVKRADLAHQPSPQQHDFAAYQGPDAFLRTGNEEFGTGYPPGSRVPVPGHDRLHPGYQGPAPDPIEYGPNMFKEGARGYVPITREDVLGQRNNPRPYAYIYKAEPRYGDTFGTSAAEYEQPHPPPAQPQQAGRHPRPRLPMEYLYPQHPGFRTAQPFAYPQSIAMDASQQVPMDRADDRSEPDEGEQEILWTGPKRYPGPHPNQPKPKRHHDDQ